MFVSEMSSCGSFLVPPMVCPIPLTVRVQGGVNLSRSTSLKVRLIFCETTASSISPSTVLVL